jgi:hypothetical protein
MIQSYNNIIILLKSVYMRSNLFLLRSHSSYSPSYIILDVRGECMIFIVFAPSDTYPQTTQLDSGDTRKKAFFLTLPSG